MKDHIWAQEEGRHKTWGHKSDINPPGRSGGLKGHGDTSLTLIPLGALEASRDMEMGQVASRAVPIPGPTVEQGVQVAMVEPHRGSGERGRLGALWRRGRFGALWKRGPLGVLWKRRRLGVLWKRGRLVALWRAGRNQQGLWRAGRNQQVLWRAGRNQQGHWSAGRNQQGHWRAGRNQQGLWRAGRIQQGHWRALARSRHVNGRLGEPRMVAKGSHERQTRMSRRRRHRSSANSSRFPANTGLDELRTVVTSMPRVEEKKGETKKL